MNRKQIKFLPWLIALTCEFVFLALLFLASPASAGTSAITGIPGADTGAGLRTSKEWEFRIGFPGWIPIIDGDLAQAELLVRSTSISRMFSRAGCHRRLSLSLRHNRWELFGDGEYIAVSDSVQLPGLLFTDADIKLKTGFWQMFLGYRLINCEKGSLTLFAGARYNYAGVDFDIANNNDPRFPLLRRRLGIPDSLRVDGSTDWVDPIVASAVR